MIRMMARRVRNLLRFGQMGAFLKGVGRFRLPSRGLEEVIPGCADVSLLLPASQVFFSPKEAMVVPPGPLLAMAAICQAMKPKNILEMGTYRGTSTLVMAMNTPEDARILTVDISPGARAAHRHGMGVGGFAPYEEGEFFKNTTYASKIRQLYVDSKDLDLSQYYETMDLVFIDADHTYDFVKADSEHAFKLIRPGGIILWDDYIWNVDHPECAGVADYLHERMAEKDIFHVRGTRFGIFINPGGQR